MSRLFYESVSAETHRYRISNAPSVKVDGDEAGKHLKIRTDTEQFPVFGNLKGYLEANFKVSFSTYFT